jgi:ribose-phosphate pyrophosphokinase
LDRIDRKNPFDKMFDSTNESNSDIESAATSPTLPPAGATGIAPVISGLRIEGEVNKPRLLAPRGIRPQALSQPSQLLLPTTNGNPSALNPQNCVTSDQVNPHKGGYKHWVARSGTLIANLLVTAGKYFLTSSCWLVGNRSMEISRLTFYHC